MLYIVRHGSTKLNAGDPADPIDYYRGWVDEPLSTFGVLTIIQTSEWFRGKNVDMIVSSPLARARETMEMISKVTNCSNWRLDTRLLPWHIGVFTGEAITDENKAVLLDLQIVQPWMAPPQGEPYNTFLKRYGPALQDYLERSKKLDIVLIAHHRNCLSVPVILQGKPPSMHGPPEPGGIIKVDQRGNVRELFEPPILQQAGGPTSS